MKTDVYRFEKAVSDISSIAGIASKIAVYNGLDKKQELKLTLLCEELVEMLPNLLIYGQGQFWIENDGPKYEIHVSAAADSMLSSIDREEILSISTSGKNAAAVGIMNKIRIAAEVLLSNYAHSAGTAGMTFPDSHYAYYNMGTYSDGDQWSLQSYRQNAKDKENAWDELERSVIARLADDVTVGIIGGKVEVTVTKTF